MTESRRPMTEAEQFQIDDEVLYVDQMIHTRVTGYLWWYTTSGAPTVAAYELACGCTVPYEAIVHVFDGRADPEEMELSRKWAEERRRYADDVARVVADAFERSCREEVDDSPRRSTWTAWAKPWARS
jgi:GAF domain-containing protein